MCYLGQDPKMHLWHKQALHNSAPYQQDLDPRNDFQNKKQDFDPNPFSKTLPDLFACVSNPVHGPDMGAVYQDDRYAGKAGNFDRLDEDGGDGGDLHGISFYLCLLLLLDPISDI